MAQQRRVPEARLRGRGEVRVMTKRGIKRRYARASARGAWRRRQAPLGPLPTVLWLLFLAALCTSPWWLP